jgi:response regulator of citrate/malate metabolism
MKIFDCSQDEIDGIINTDKVKGLLSEHLNKSINSDTIKSLIKEINEQGAKFINIYEGLLKEQ